MAGIEVDALDNTADVETPERIRFRYQAAGPVRRGLAYLIDLLVRVVVVIVVGMLALGGSIGGLKATGGLSLLILFLLEWGYGVLFETLWRGQTLGKRALGLRVVKEGGYPVGFLDSVLRNLLRAADFLPLGYILGLLVMATDQRFRRLGDRVAGTMVVIESRAVVGAPLVLVPAATPLELAALPHRPPVTAEELDAIELLLRQSRLSPARRQELAEMVAPVFAARMRVSEADPVRFLGLLYQRCVGSRRPAAASGGAPAGAGFGAAGAGAVAGVGGRS